MILPSKTFGAVEARRLAAALESGANENLRRVGASGHALDPPSLAAIGRALAANKHVTSVAVGDKSMGDDGAIALLSPLETVRGGGLERIDLSWKGLSSRGAAALGRAFVISPALSRLNLSRNEGVGDEGAIAFCAAVAERGRANDDDAAPCLPALEELDLADCGIGPRGAAALAECLASRTETERRVSLRLDGNPLSGAEGTRAVASLAAASSLSSSSLVGCGVGDDGARALAEGDGPRRGLATLDLSDNGIGPAGAAELGRSFASSPSSSSWCDLTDLRIARNRSLGATGVADLCRGVGDGVPTLRRLDLSATACGPEGAVAALRAVRGLTHLRLFDNDLGARGFSAIADAMREDRAMRGLVELDLGGNRADDDAVANLLDAISASRKTSTSALRVLEIGGNRFGEKAEAALKETTRLMPELDVARDRPKNQNQRPGPPSS